MRWWSCVFASLAGKIARHLLYRQGLFRNNAEIAMRRCLMTSNCSCRAIIFTVVEKCSGAGRDRRKSDVVGWREWWICLCVSKRHRNVTQHQLGTLSRRGTCWFHLTVQKLSRSLHQDAITKRKQTEFIGRRIVWKTLHASSAVDHCLNKRVQSCISVVVWQVATPNQRRARSNGQIGRWLTRL